MLDPALSPERVQAIAQTLITAHRSRIKLPPPPSVVSASASASASASPSPSPSTPASTQSDCKQPQPSVSVSASACAASAQNALPASEPVQPLHVSEVVVSIAHTGLRVVQLSAAPSAPTHPLRSGATAFDAVLFATDSVQHKEEEPQRTGAGDGAPLCCVMVGDDKGKAHRTSLQRSLSAALQFAAPYVTAKAQAQPKLLVASPDRTPPSLFPILFTSCCFSFIRNCCLGWRCVLVSVGVAVCAAILLAHFSFDAKTQSCMSPAPFALFSFVPLNAVCRFLCYQITGLQRPDPHMPPPPVQLQPRLKQPLTQPCAGAWTKRQCDVH